MEAAGVTLMCAHNQLFMPAVAKAKVVIDSGVLGDVYEVRTTDSFHNDFDPSTMGWRASAAKSRGSPPTAVTARPSSRGMRTVS